MMNTKLKFSVREAALTLLDASGGAFDLYGVFAGHRLGLYETLAAGPLTAMELGARSGMSASGLQTWLTQQVEAGFLGRAGCAAGVRYTLDRRVRDVLLDHDAIEALAPAECFHIVATGAALQECGALPRAA